MPTIFDAESYGCLEHSLLCARILQAVTDGNIHAADQLLRQADPTVTITRSGPSIDTMPAFLFAAAARNDYAFVAGAQNLGLAQRTLTGWAGPLRDTLVLSGWNLFAAQVGDTIRAQMIAEGAHSNVKQLYVGHSLGGMVAQWMANRTRQDDPGMVPTIVTFGAPKLSQVSLASANRNAINIRWMNAQDPIPLLPPALSDLPSLVTLALPLQVREFGLYTHWKGGLKINPDGTFTDSILPDISLVNGITSLAAFILSYDGKSTLPVHGMQDYVNAIDAARLLAQKPSDPFRQVGTVEEPETSSRLQVTQAEARVVSTYVALQQQQNRPVLSVPPVQLFTMVRAGRLYLITFGNQTVAVTPVRKTARSLCRQFNVALRHLQATALVEPDTLLSQMDAYLQAATTPGSGFSPTMNTTLPS